MKPFCKRGNISGMGEKALIARICSRLGAAVPQYPHGPGDDCALFASKNFKKNVFATSDAVILGVHFAENTPPRLAGEKLIKRNVSDIASMGALPRIAMTSAILSKDLSPAWLDAFCCGAGNAASKYGINIVGGDVAAAGNSFFSMHLALLGDSDLPPLLRRGARDSDFLFVSGELGYSFESGRHLHFEPRLREGRFLAKWNKEHASKVTSCTDISDGLSGDICNIIPPDCKALLDCGALPRAKFRSKTASLERVLCDGEDYELLFSFCGSDSDRANFEKKYAKAIGKPPIYIGRIAKKTRPDEGALFLNFGDGILREFRGRGFDHYLRD